MNTKKLAVLVSGTGSLLEAMLKRGLRIDLVLADGPCRGIDEVSKGYPEVTSRLIRRKSFGKDFDQKCREKYTEEVLAALHEQQIEVVAMAGWMTVFSPSLFLPKDQGGYGGRILNATPPSFPPSRERKPSKTPSNMAPR